MQGLGNDALTGLDFVSYQTQTCHPSQALQDFIGSIQGSTHRLG